MVAHLIGDVDECVLSLLAGMCDLGDIDWPIMAMVFLLALAVVCLELIQRSQINLPHH